MSALTLALFQPDIPQNAGTMLRMCACLGLDAIIIEPAGFPTSDRHFKRSGMDYLDRVKITRSLSFDDFEVWRAHAGPGGSKRRLVLLTTRGAESYVDCAFRPDDVLLVGRESAGVPDDVLAAADVSIRIPLQFGLRSLNVAVAAAMVIGEALRQTGGFPTS
jgi:tRNA (cytidine/uridine-2'-O-)-methyltransferase